MIKVYFEKGLHADLVATFESEDLYELCAPILEAQAEKEGYIITEAFEN
jgi:hypothetical protein